MIISHKHKFIFIKTAKTAGTSVEVFLSGICSREDVVTPILPPEENHHPRNHYGFYNPLPEIPRIGFERALKDLRWRKKYYNHMPAYKVRERVPKQVWQTYTTFCIERNPWELELSCMHMFKKAKWHNRYDPDLNMGHYLHLGYRVLNYQLYMDESEQDIIVDRVLRYENLNEELAQLFEELGVPFSGQLGVQAKGDYRKTKRSYREQLTVSQAEQIARLHAIDIALHGYKF